MTPTLRDQLQRALGQAYVLERELGGGGMSHVFLAHEQALGRQVVVKVLLPELAAGVNVERFRREIQLAAQLQHPHIVPLLSAGEADGLPYFIMPFVTGESLRARMEREGELPIAETVRILRDVVSALAYAHTRGVVHRDVKPDNVLLSGGVAVVTDFGVAKAVSASAESGSIERMTSLGVALGTPTYMSPEQATANPQTDHRSDIYALGVMTYEMLTGMPPFTGRSPQAVLAAHVVEEAQPVERRRPAVPPLLATLVHECLAKRPADRPQSATDLLHSLDGIATPSGGTTPTLVTRTPSPPPPPSVTPVSRPRLGARWPLIASLAAAAAIFGAAFLVLRAPTAPSGPTPLSRPGAVIPASPSAKAASPSSVPESLAARSAPGGTDSVRGAPLRGAVPSAGAEAARPSRPSAPRAPVPHRSPPSRETASVPMSPAEASVDSSPLAPAPPARADTTSAVPPPSAVAPVPAPVAKPAPAPTPPPPPADPRPEIRGVIKDYARAVESESLAELRRVYPAMTAGQQQGWEQFFRLVHDVKADLSVGTLDLTGATAEAQVGGTYTYLNSSTQRAERRPVSFQATLRREEGRWRIAQIR